MGPAATYGRAPWPRREELTEAQRDYYDAVTSSPRARHEIMDQDGRLVGPFNARLLDPPVGTAIQSVGAALRFSATLTDRERELVILTIARVERSHHEWRSHAAVAKQVGVSDGELGCIGATNSGWPTDASEIACLDLARELIETADVSDQAFDRAATVLSLAKIFDVVSLVGHYRHTAMALRVWRVPGESTH